MTYLTHQRNFFWGLAKRMWCMLFHKHGWQEHGSGTKCSICGEEYKDNLFGY